MDYIIYGCSAATLIESVCDLHVFAKEILGYAMLCGFYVFCLGNSRTHDARNARDACTSTSVGLAQARPNNFAVPNMESVDPRN